MSLWENVMPREDGAMPRRRRKWGLSNLADKCLRATGPYKSVDFQSPDLMLSAFL